MSAEMTSLKKLNEHQSNDLRHLTTVAMEELKQLKNECLSTLDSFAREKKENDKSREEVQALAKEIRQCKTRQEDVLTHELNGLRVEDPTKIPFSYFHSIIISLDCQKRRKWPDRRCSVYTYCSWNCDGILASYY